MAKTNPFRFSTKYQDDETDLLYYGYRYYSPSTGRFLCKDPIEEQGGLNLYAFVANNPIGQFDVMGLWGTEVHLVATRSWARKSGYPDQAANAIGEADEAVDGGRTGTGGTGWGPWIGGDQSYHFDRNQGKGKDTRIQHYERHLKAAKQACSRSADDPEKAAEELGTALHPYQDWVAHGDHGIYDDDGIWSTHNSLSPQRTFGNPSHYPDDVRLDAINGGDGRPAGLAIHTITVNRGVSVRDYALYERGSKRIALTRRLTTATLAEFRNHVKQNGDCKCKKYFGVE